MSIYDVPTTQSYTVVGDPKENGYYLVVKSESQEVICQCANMMTAGDIVRALETTLRLRQIKVLGF